MMAHVATIKVLGDVLEVRWTGSVWESPATHRTHTSALAAMREELQEYFKASGEDVEDENTSDEIESLLLEMTEDESWRDEIVAAIEAADPFGPEEVADACIRAYQEGRDWRKVLADAVAFDKAGGHRDWIEG